MLEQHYHGHFKLRIHLQMSVDIYFLIYIQWVMQTVHLYAKVISNKSIFCVIGDGSVPMNCGNFLG